MNVLFVLSLLFLLLTFAVFRIEGLFQVTGLFMNVAVFLALLVLIDRGAPIIPAACVAFLAVAAITLFFVNGVNQKTKIAFVCVLVFLGLFLLLFPLVLLLFAFMGSNLALIAWFQDLSISFGEMINSKAFVSELVVCLITGLAAVIILPITAWAASWYFLKRNRME